MEDQNNKVDSLARQQPENVSISINNPSEFIKNLPTIERTVNLQACIEGKTLKALERENLGKELKISLDLQLMRLAASMNLTRNITGAQVETIVLDLIELFPYETLEDFILVFKRIRQGYYGTDYNRLDGATIRGCMQKHLDEKAALREKNHNIEKSRGSDLNLQSVIDSYKNGNPLLKTWKETEDEREVEFRKMRMDWYKNQQQKQKEEIEKQSQQNTPENGA